MCRVKAILNIETYCTVYTLYSVQLYSVPYIVQRSRIYGADCRLNNSYKRLYISYTHTILPKILVYTQIQSDLKVAALSSVPQLIEYCSISQLLSRTTIFSCLVSERGLLEQTFLHYVGVAVMYSNIVSNIALRSIMSSTMSNIVSNIVRNIVSKTVSKIY